MKKLSLLLFLFLWTLPTGLLAQVDPSSSLPPGATGLPGDTAAAPDASAASALSIQESPRPEPAPAATPTPGGAWTVQVQLRHGTEADEDLSGQPVLLHAVRPRGPFQTEPAPPVHTWTAVTDSQGLATFPEVDEQIARSGLRLAATSSFGGIAFESPMMTAGDGVTLPLTVFDRGHDLDGLRIRAKRVVVEPWEEFLIFSQFITFELEGDRAVDLSMVPQAELQRGLPIRLPIRAQGIHFSGPGDHEIVNNVVFWRPVLRPGQPVAIQIRFSKAARSSELIYEQTMEFPVDELQIIAPLQTQHQRQPRLDRLGLAAPGFTIGGDAGALGLRTDMEFLIATRGELDAGESYTFRVDGLPFGRPLGGWISLGLALLAALFVFGYGVREHRRLHDERGREQLERALKAQRDALFTELANLQAEKKELADEGLDEEIMALEEDEERLRERLALVLRNLRDLQSDAGA